MTVSYTHLDVYKRQALRKLAGTVSRTNCIVVFINQLREKIGVMYGNPATTPGGRAMRCV